jgi:hypothetical protein
MKQIRTKKRLCSDIYIPSLWTKDFKEYLSQFKETDAWEDYWEDYSDSIKFNFELGNGTIDYAKYKEVGEYVDFFVKFTLANKSVIKKFPMQFSLPLKAESRKLKIFKASIGLKYCWMGHGSVSYITLGAIADDTTCCINTYCYDADGSIDEDEETYIKDRICNSARREERIFCVRGKYKYKSRVGRLGVENGKVVFKPFK